MDAEWMRRDGAVFLLCLATELVVLILVAAFLYFSLDLICSRLKLRVDITVYSIVRETIFVILLLN